MSRLFGSLLLVAFLFPVGLSAQDTAQPKPKIKRNPDKISVEEIEAAPESMQNAFDLVKQLRPNWLIVRGPSSITLGTPGAQVYVDGVHRGGPVSLEEVPRQAVREITRLRGPDATQRWGMNHENGAILVKTR